MSTFHRIERPPRHALVCRAEAVCVADALLEGKGCQSVPSVGGRGGVCVFPIHGGEGVLRRYRRGGAARWLLRESFVLGNRPVHELRVHDYLYQSGIRVPEPLGACWERHGLLLRGAIATRRVDAESLKDWLRTNPSSAENMLGRVGTLIREMHDRGVIHADLQIGNIIVGEDGPYLIDFDKACRKKSVSRTQRARNLFRLRRSMEKHKFSDEQFAAVVRGYGLGQLPRWLDAAYRLKGRASDLLAVS